MEAHHWWRICIGAISNKLVSVSLEVSVWGFSLSPCRVSLPTHLDNALQQDSLTCFQQSLLPAPSWSLVASLPHNNYQQLLLVTVSRPISIFSFGDNEIEDEISLCRDLSHDFEFTWRRRRFYWKFKAQQTWELSMLSPPTQESEPIFRILFMRLGLWKGFMRFDLWKGKTGVAGYYYHRLVDRFSGFIPVHTM